MAEARSHINMFGYYSNALGTIHACWYAIWVRLAAMVAFWEAIWMGLEVMITIASLASGSAFASYAGGCGFESNSRVIPKTKKMVLVVSSLFDAQHKGDNASSLSLSLSDCALLTARRF